MGADFNIRLRKCMKFFIFEELTPFTYVQKLQEIISVEYFNAVKMHTVWLLKMNRT